MTPSERAAALARCDAEIARIEEEGATGEHPAWLITLGAEDWKAEKRHILNEHVLQPLNASDPTLEPCGTCPWRVNRDASTIPNYNHDKACGLMNTVGDGDDFRPIMACHGSPEGAEFACLGYLAREGWRNINVRLLLAQGKIAHPDHVVAACERAGIELHPDYPAVLRKLATKRAIEREDASA